MPNVGASSATVGATRGPSPGGRSNYNFASAPVEHPSFFHLDLGPEGESGGRNASNGDVADSPVGADLLKIDDDDDVSRNQGCAIRTAGNLGKRGDHAVRIAGNDARDFPVCRL